MKISLKKKLAAAAAAATIVGGAGAALAYWTSTGAGAGSATAGTSSTWEVTTSAATGGALTPDGPTDTVPFHVKNNSTGVQGLQSVVVKVANADGTAWTSVSGCDASDFSVGGEVVGVSHTIPYSPVQNVLSGATFNDSVTVKMINKPLGNQDGCKLAVVPLYVSAA